MTTAVELVTGVIILPQRWADRGATHLSVNTRGAGLRTVDDHLAVLDAATPARA